MTQQKRISEGKYKHLLALSDERGIIAALAMDQRRTLRKDLQAHTGREASNAEVIEVKSLVTEVLSPYASAVLLDPEYGLEAAKLRASNAGLILTYEMTGYDAAKKGRLPRLLPGWSVARYADAGADAVKLLVYYDPDDEESINTFKQAFIERVGAECHAHDIPLFVELVSYSDEVGEQKSLAFAHVKPAKVKQLTREFSQPRYGIDILKLEIPVNMRFTAGTGPDDGGPYAYTLEEARQHFRDVAAEARVPFIYLSAGVSDAVFLASLELANELGTPYAGVLCGRATWQDGLPVYAQGGAPALRAWLERQGVQNIQALNAVLSKGAQPWWNYYGGKEHLNLVPSYPLERGNA
ncbi:MAG: tagatose 1,6-diphosphate aldolase [Ktedonobacteraceae bacterium]